MIIAKVIGNMVATQKNHNLNGQKFMIVEPLDMRTLEPLGNPFPTVDCIGVGIGETVLVTTHGSSARIVIKNSNAPVNDAIIGVIDNLSFLNEDKS